MNIAKFHLPENKNYRVKTVTFSKAALEAGEKLLNYYREIDPTLSFSRLISILILREWKETCAPPISAEPSA